MDSNRRQLPQGGVMLLWLSLFYLLTGVSCGVQRPQRTSVNRAESVSSFPDEAVGL